MPLRSTVVEMPAQPIHQPLQQSAGDALGKPEPAPAPGAEPTPVAAAGAGPRRRAMRRLRHNRGVMIAAGVFVVIVLVCLAAPLYASQIAKTGPNDNHISETVTVDGTEKPIVSQGGVIERANGEVELDPGGVPLGPQWFAAGGRYVLGADQNGRDVATRLLYGGRVSLLIGFASTMICVSIAVLLALMAGFYGGWVDSVVGRFLDVLWALPG